MIDNVRDGFDLYDIESGCLLKTFNTHHVRDRRSRRVAFGENDGVVVGGSECGVVYVFDTQSGGALDVLHHARGVQVHSITVRE